MPRSARMFSESGFEHIVARGIGRQLLFENQSDYEKYIAFIEKYSKEIGVTVCAYCLMSNHVHLLLFNREGMISQLMQKIGIAYSQYFNNKYDRRGHLFQNRYFNEPIKSEQQLVRAFRYILNNPLKAGLCRAADYKWSSYNSYGCEESFVDTSAIENLIGDIESFRLFMDEDNDDEFFELDGYEHSDERAKEIMKSCLGIEIGSELQKYDRRKRDNAIRTLRENGISVRQIERLTGINRGTIQRV